MKQCANCGNEDSLRTCSGCNWTWYCTKECQLDHRPIHKYNCNPSFADRYPTTDMFGTKIEKLTEATKAQSRGLAKLANQHASGAPHCSNCGDTEDVEQLFRFGGILICSQCLRLHSLSRSKFT